MRKQYPLKGRKSRQRLFGKGRAPVKGESFVQKMSTFLGSVLTPENTNEFKRKQIEYFKERFVSDVVFGREKILAEPDKTPEEIDILVQEYNQKQPDEKELHEMAVRFAIQMTTKENKHHKAYLSGKPFYTYKGQRYPVMTQALVEQTQSIHEIIKQAQEADDIKRRIADSEDPLKVPEDGATGDHEALRPNTGNWEDPEDEYSAGDEEPIDGVLSGESNNM